MAVARWPTARSLPHTRPRRRNDALHAILYPFPRPHPYVGVLLWASRVSQTGAGWPAGQPVIGTQSGTTCRSRRGRNVGSGGTGASPEWRLMGGVCSTCSCPGH